MVAMAHLAESLEYLLDLPAADLVDEVRKIDTDALEDYDLVTLLRAQVRLVSHFQAGVYETMAAIGDRLDEMGYPEAGPPEIATALRLTRNASETEYDFAVALRCTPRSPRLWPRVKSTSAEHGC